MQSDVAGDHVSQLGPVRGGFGGELAQFKEEP